MILQDFDIYIRINNSTVMIPIVTSDIIPRSSWST